jgi:hypothetical protein
VFFCFACDDLDVSLRVIMGKVIYQIVQSLMFCLYLTTFIIAFTFPKKRETPIYMKMFYVYPLVGSFVTFIIFLNAYNVLPYVFAHHINLASVFFHYIFLGRFMYIVCDKNQSIKVIAIIFFVVITFFIVYDFLNVSYTAISISNSFLFVLCLFYFFSLFIAPTKVKLFQEPSFWVCCGIFFGSGFIIPSTALLKYLTFNSISLKYLYGLIALIGFAIMYIFFIKAFLCLPRLRK